MATADRGCATSSSRRRLGELEREVFCVAAGGEGPALHQAPGRHVGCRIEAQDRHRGGPAMEAEADTGHPSSS